MSILHVYRRAAAVGLTVGLLLLAVMPAVANAATPPITFNMDMFGRCVSGNAADGATIDVTWRSSNGTLKAEGTADHPYGGGYFELCEGKSTQLRPGDQIKVSDGSYTRQYTVPNLTIHLDRVADVMTGTGPASRTLRLCISTGDFGRCHSVRVGQDGTWSYNPHHDIFHYKIGYGVSLEWTSPNDDVLSIPEVNAPFVAVTLGQAKFTGETDPGGNAKILLNGNASGSVTGGDDGYFAGKFRKSNGTAVKVQAGDRVHSPSLASGADWIMPQIDGTASASTDVVSGRCYDSGTFSGTVSVDVYRTGRLRGTTSFGTESDGSFSVDMRRDVGDFFENPANIKPGNRVVIGCIQTTGDVAQLEVRAN
jgi:hypothetical protein